MAKVRKLRRPRLRKEGVEAAGWIHGVAGGSTAALCLTGALTLGIALVLTGVFQ